MVEKDWRKWGSLYLGNYLQFCWKTERLARGKTEDANEKSIQSQVHPLMDEGDTLRDEKALSVVASWLTSSLFWLVAEWKDSMWHTVEYIIVNWLIQTNNKLKCSFLFRWEATDFSFRWGWIFATKIARDWVDYWWTMVPNPLFSAMKITFVWCVYSFKACLPASSHLTL